MELPNPTPEPPPENSVKSEKDFAHRKSKRKKSQDESEEDGESKVKGQVTSPAVPPNGVKKDALNGFLSHRNKRMKKTNAKADAASSGASDLLGEFHDQADIVNI
jgi:hypothetical protein